jgi:Zn-finger nucleic acid-binding protein
MKCPACKNPLREKNAGGMTLDLCYGGCGGIWFDAAELERVSVSAPAATTLHTIWQIPSSNVRLGEPRVCPRCPEQVLERKWFSDLKQVEIDQCPECGGIWLDAGEFSRIYEESKASRETSPLWARAMSEAAALVNA